MSTTVSNPVKTKKVTGRRSVRYESYDDLLAEAERMAGANARRLGNWSPAQIYEHLARSMNGSIDGLGFMLPAPVRWLMTLLMKKRFLTGSLPAGFRSTPKFVAETDLPAETALESLRQAISRQKSEPSRVPHPAFGDIGKEGWDQFHLRHAELHMSFLVED